MGRSWWERVEGRWVGRPVNPRFRLYEGNLFTAFRRKIDSVEDLLQRILLQEFLEIG
jgi:hypothetical protein